MEPVLSYTLWFSQRNGSTVLAKGLESTGIAGIPNEWFNIDPHTLADLYGDGRIESVREGLWKKGCSPNRVFALKYGLPKPRHDILLASYRAMPGIPEGLSDLEVWNYAFPNSKHIFLTRRNKVRQAVSWWKAIKSGEWHRKTGEKPADHDIRDAYDFNAIRHLLTEAVMLEAGVEEFLSERKEKLFTVAYEDMVLDFEGTVRSIIDYLQIPEATSYTVDVPFYEKLADDISEEWVQRFRKELQKDWSNRGW